MATLTTATPTSPTRRETGERALRTVAPRVDIYETDKAYVLLADMPGVSADGLDVQAERDTLIVRGRVERPERPFDYQEFELADYYRVFTLTEDLDTAGIQAILRDGVLRVTVEERPDETPAGHLTRELERDYRAVVEEILKLRGDDGRISAFLRSITSPGALADTSGYSPDLSVAQKIELLETLDVVERLKLSLKFQQERLTELVVRKKIREDVEGGAQKAAAKK